MTTGVREAALEDIKEEVSIPQESPTIGTYQKQKELIDALVQSSTSLADKCSDSENSDTIKSPEVSPTKS